MVHKILRLTCQAGGPRSKHAEQGMFDYMAWTCLASMGDDEGGATAVEYGLIASLVSVAIVVALTFAGEALRQLFGIVTQGLT